MGSKRDEILISLYEAPEIAQAIGKMEPEHLRDDLRQEMFLAVCKLPECRLVEMFENGHLKWFMLATMRNMIMSSDNSFHRTYRRSVEITREAQEQAVDTYDEGLLNRVNSVIDSLGFFDQSIFRLYVEHDNSSIKVARATEISERTVRCQIARIRVKLQKKLRNAD